MDFSVDYSKMSPSNTYYRFAMNLFRQFHLLLGSSTDSYKIIKNIRESNTKFLSISAIDYSTLYNELRQYSTNQSITKLQKIDAILQNTITELSKIFKDFENNK